MRMATPQRGVARGGAPIALRPAFALRATARRAAYAMRALFAQLAAVPKLAMRFPTTEYVASLAMVRFSNPASPCCVTSVIALCAGVGGP